MYRLTSPAEANGRRPFLVLEQAVAAALRTLVRCPELPAVEVEQCEHAVPRATTWRPVVRVERAGDQWVVQVLT